MRQQLFLATANLSRRVPNFRGKVRTMLAFYRMLGLEGSHIHTDARLQKPVPYDVRLDMHCMHERMALLMDEYEADTVEFIERVYGAMGDSGSILDIGANIGLICIPAARLLQKHVSEEPIVYAVEAVTSNQEALRSNILRNGMEDSIRVISKGVGDSQKKVFIAVEKDVKDGEGTGTANIINDNPAWKCEKIPLEITTIDDLVDQGEIGRTVQVIKVDIDGYDLFAMQGAKGMLQSTRPAIYGEFMAHCMQWHGQTVTDVLEFMETVGYCTYKRVNPNEWRFSDSVDVSDYVQDLLIIPKEKVTDFQWCID